MYQVASSKAEEFIHDGEIVETLAYARENRANRPLIEAILQKAAEGGVAVRDERSDTDHLGFELPDEKQIPDQIVHRLSRAADHDARTGLVADLFEGVQAFDAVIEGHPDGMEPTIVIGSDRFMPQQVTVRARFEQRPVGGFCPFPQREGDGAVGPAATHLPDQSGQQFVVQSRVFSALKYECPESQPVALFAAGQYGFRGQTVAFCQTIAASNAAVAAVVAAVIADFDQPPNENSVSEMHTGDLAGRPVQVFSLFGGRIGQQKAQLFRGKGAVAFQLIDELFHSPVGFSV